MNPVLYAYEFQDLDQVTIGDGPAVTVAGGRFTTTPTGADRLTLSSARVTGGPMTVLRAGSEVLTPWPYQKLAVVDVETTGLGPEAKIVEIAIVLMRFGCVVSTWSSLVHPGMPIPPDATAVHGITDAMVAHAPTIETLRAEIAARLADASVVAGYNIFGYDEGVLAREGIIPHAPIVDALPVLREHGVSVHDGLPAKRWKSESERRETPYPDRGDESAPVRIDYRRMGRHSLERASRELGVAYPEPNVGTALHRATWDAILTGRVLWALRRWCPWDALEAESAMRLLLARQSASMDAFMAKIRAEERAARVSVDAKIEGLLATLRIVLAEHRSFQEWKAGARAPQTHNSLFGDAADAALRALHGVPDEP